MAKLSKNKNIKRSNKKKNVIKLPPRFKEFIQDKKIQEEFVEFARGKETGMKSFKELTSYQSGWQTSIAGKSYNPDDISLQTYNLMRKDAQLQMGLKVIKLPIKAMKWWVVCEDKNIQAFLQFVFKRIWKSSVSAILNALDFGWSACEKVWEVQNIEVNRKEGDKQVIAYKGEAVLLKKLKDPDPTSITILTTKNGDFDGFEQQTTGGGTVSVPVEKSFVFTNEKEFGNLYGKSLLRYAYDYWYWAILMYQFLNRYFERRGVPPTKARAPYGKTKLSDGTVIDSMQLGQQAGESLTESSVVCLPSTIDEKGNYKWDLEYMKDDQRADMFIKYIEHLNAMKLRALFVPERMIIQDTDMGARAVAKTHLDVFLMGLEGLIEDIVDHFNKYLIPQLVEYNFGKDASPAYIETSGLSVDSKNLLKQIIISIIKKGDANIPLDMIKALEDLDLPILSEDKMVDKIKDDNKEKEEDIEQPEKLKEPEQNIEDDLGDDNAKTEKRIDNNREEYRLSEIRRLLEFD